MKITEKHNDFAVALGYSDARALLDALASGDAISLMIRADNAQDIIEDTERVERIIEIVKNSDADLFRYTEDLLRGVTKALRKASELHD